MAPLGSIPYVSRGSNSEARIHRRLIPASYGLIIGGLGLGLVKGVPRAIEVRPRDGVRDQ